MLVVVLFQPFICFAIMLKTRLLSHRISKSVRLISSFIDVSDQVNSALKEKLPVVALETALVTHGMSFPENIETSLAAEKAILSRGAVPATIAIMQGRVKVGLSQNQLVELSEDKISALKVSRRDFPFVISKKMNGGTTVSGTMVIADLVGIKVFATGGIGGVHRGGETTLDVSADLTELGRTPVCVISSGVKAILDIRRTLEFLETHGVCVATLGPPGSTFPTFYSQGCGIKAPLCVDTAHEAAQMFHSLVHLGIQSGMLLAVPIPPEHALPDAEVEQAIESSMKEAMLKGIYGKEITPFLLRRISVLTSGRTLAANQALIVNNADVAAQVAIEFSKLQAQDL